MRGAAEWLDSAGAALVATSIQVSVLARLQGSVSVVAAKLATVVTAPHHAALSFPSATS